jgi:UDP-2,3-diacylglucosamine pyrophosphatase LpxH
MADITLNPWLIKQLIEGRFAKVVPRKGAAELDGAALAKWKAFLLTQHYPNEDLAREVHYQYKSDLPLPTPPIAGSRGTLSPPEASFVYMDVGGWLGSHGGAWAKFWNGLNVKRDLGIVAGPLVLLCSFEYAFHKDDTYDHGGDCEAWKKQSKASEPAKSVERLLRHLRATVSGASKLGTMVVRDFAVAPWQRSWGVPDKIHVILGDMHLAVLDDRFQTYAGGATVSADGHKVTVPERVPRRGRVDVRTLEKLVKELVPTAGMDGTKALKDLVDVANKALTLSTPAKVAIGGLAGAALIAAAPRLLPALPAAYGTSWAAGDWAGIKDDTMTAADAEKWYEFYCVGVDGGAPADVFEQAGEHLHELLRRLAKYADESTGCLPAKLVQLGDMFDYWVGFSCHYEPSKSPDEPVKPDHRYTESLVRYWTDNALSNTRQGREVAEALAIAQQKLDPVYLYGNHDNYLGAMGVRPSYRFHGEEKHLPQRRAYYTTGGIYMEHGHQWEPSNADNKATVPIVSTLTLGTPSPLGMFVTQAAFVRPVAIRNFEGDAAGVVAKASGTYGQRLDQIIGSAIRYWNKSGGFGVYVMGHTHAPALTRVIVASQHPGTIVSFGKSSLADPLIRVFQLEGTNEFHGARFVDEGFGPAKELAVGWSGMIGDKESEWVSLEDPHAPCPGAQPRAVLGLSAMNGGGAKNGIHRFARVPPGMYQARWYLTPEATEPFRRSGNLTAVEGISIEGDAHATTGATFVYDPHKNTFERPIFLRWAFNPARFQHDEFVAAWFALYRDGEPATAIGPTALAEGPKAVPIARFFQITRGGARSSTSGTPQEVPVWAHGRWDLASGRELSRVFADALARTGRFEIRAFRDATHRYPLGSAKLQIVTPAQREARTQRR